MTQAKRMKRASAWPNMTGGIGMLVVLLFFGQIALTVLAAAPAGTGTPEGRAVSHSRSLSWSYDIPADYTLANVTVSNGTAQLAQGGGVGWTKKADSTINRNAHPLAFDRTAGVMYTATGHDTGFAHSTALYSYTPSTGAWAQKASLPSTGRMISSMAYDSANNNILLVAGFDGASTVLRDVWQYTPGTDQWLRRADLPVTSQGGTLMYDAAGSQFFYWAPCENKFYRYTPSNNTWLELGMAAGARYCASWTGAGAGFSQAVFDPVRRTVIAFGGLQSSSPPAYRTTWLYDVANATWSTGQNMPTARYDGAAFYDEERNVVVALGGHDDNNPVGIPAPATYNPVANTWTAGTKINGMEDRYYTAAVWDSTDKVGILFAGWGTATNFLKDVWWYTPAVANSGTATASGQFEDNLSKLNAVWWNATVPGGTTVKVEIRSSADGQTWSNWETVTKGGTVSKPTSVGKSVQVRVTLTGDGTSTPVFQDLSLGYTVNQVPAVSAGADLTAYKGDTVTLLAAGSDADTDTLTYAWAQASGTAVTINSPATATATLVPTVSGIYVFNITVTDTLGAKAWDLVLLNVTNRLPLASAGTDISALKGLPVTLNGSGSDPDAVDTLTFLWSQKDGPAVALDGADTATAGFTPPSVGTYTFTLVVSDGEALSVPDDVNVVVNTRPPVASLKADLTAVLTGDTVTFDGSASSDPDGKVASYRFDFGDGKDSGWVNGSSATHSYTAPGNYSAKLTVRDSDGVESAPGQALLITVRAPNQAPALNPTITPATGNTLTEFTLAANAVDSDGTVVDVTWVIGKVTKKGDSVKITFDAPGNYSATVTAKDDGGLTTKRTLNFTVAAVPPVASLKLLTEKPVARGTAQFDAAGSKDADGKVVSYLLDFGDNSTSGWVSSPSFTHTYNKAGTFTAILKVKDDDGVESEVATATVVVAAPKTQTTGAGSVAGSGLALMGVLLVIIAVAAAGAFLMMRRKRGGPSSAPSPSQQAPPTQIYQQPPPPQYQPQYPEQYPQQYPPQPPQYPQQ